MELFSLLAKLTLDKSEYSKALDEAQDEANSFEEPEEQSLELDNSDFDDNLQESQDKAGDFSSSVSSVFSELKGTLTTLGIAAVVGTIVTQLKEGVELAKTHGDMIDKQSQKMGISAKAYQEWSYALNLSGASIDDLNRGLRSWQAAAGDEEQIAKLSAAFEALGIDAFDAFKKIEKGENLDELLNQTLYGLADKSPGDRGWIAKALFGNNATGLNALFNQTSEQIKEAKQEAEDLGLVMSDEEVKNAAAYMDATTRLEGALNGIKEAFAGSILPILTDATNELAKFIALFNPRNRKNNLSDAIADLDAKAFAASGNLEKASGSAQAMIDKLSSMGDYWTLDENGKKTWNALAKEFIDQYPQFEKYIDLENKTIRGNTDEIKENIKQWTIREKQRLLDENAAEKREAIARQYAEALDKEIQAELKEAEAEGERQAAILKLNDMLRSQGLATIDSSATKEEADKALLGLLESLPEDDPLQLKAGLLFKEYGELWTEAAKLRKESDDMYTEADAASESLEKYQTRLAEKMGITTDSISEANKEMEKLKKTISTMPAFPAYTFTRPEEYAIGSAYVPYDQLAVVHRGERIETATDVRRGASAGADLTGLEDRIIAAIREGMEGATVQSYLDGDEVTDKVSRKLAGQMAVRRYV